MLFKRTDIHFSGDDAHRFLPWLIGVMACLATLLLCLGLTVNGWILSSHSNYKNSFTVNIPTEKNPADKKLEEVKEILAETSGVKNVNRLSHQQIRELLQPLLGDSAALDSLPFPVVLDVTLQPNAPDIDYNALQKQLSTMAPGVEIDAHERWIEAFSNFSAAVQCLLIILALLILGAMGAMIIFTLRASLKLHARTVKLLHSIGAEDYYIARQFQQETFMLVLPGVFFGALVAGILYWITGAYMASLPVSLIPSFAMTRGHLFLLSGMPIICCLIAWTVSRWSITKQLQATL